MFQIYEKFRAKVYVIKMRKIKGDKINDKQTTTVDFCNP